MSFPEYYRRSLSNNTFREAIAKFHEYLHLTKQEIPQSMQCVTMILRSGHQSLKTLTPKPFTPQIQSQQTQITIPHQARYIKHEPLRFNAPKLHSLTASSANEQFSNQSARLTESIKVRTVPDVPLTITEGALRGSIQFRLDAKNQPLFPLSHPPPALHQPLPISSHSDVIRHATTNSMHFKRLPETSQAVHFKPVEQRVNSLCRYKPPETHVQLKPQTPATTIPPSKSLVF